MEKKKEVRKTMFDYILWRNDIDLKEVERLSDVNYVTLSRLKRGDDHNFSFKVLNRIAKSLGINIKDFYDLENGTHKYLP